MLPSPVTIQGMLARTIYCTPPLSDWILRPFSLWLLNLSRCWDCQNLTLEVFLSLVCILLRCICALGTSYLGFGVRLWLPAFINDWAQGHRMVSPWWTCRSSPADHCSEYLFFGSDCWLLYTVLSAVVFITAPYWHIVSYLLKLLRTLECEHPWPPPMIS